MILFMVLVLTFILLMVFSIVVLSAGGAALIIIFGDVFVCMFLIAWIMKKLIRRKKK